MLCNLLIITRDTLAERPCSVMCLRLVEEFVKSKSTQARKYFRKYVQNIVSHQIEPVHNVSQILRDWGEGLLTTEEAHIENALKSAAQRLEQGISNQMAVHMIKIAANTHNKPLRFTDKYPININMCIALDFNFAPNETVWSWCSQPAALAKSHCAQHDKEKAYLETFITYASQLEVEPQVMILTTLLLTLRFQIGRLSLPQITFVASKFTALYNIVRSPTPWERINRFQVMNKHNAQLGIMNQNDWADRYYGLMPKVIVGLLVKGTLFLANGTLLTLNPEGFTFDIANDFEATFGALNIMGYFPKLTEIRSALSFRQLLLQRQAKSSTAPVTRINNSK